MCIANFFITNSLIHIIKLYLLLYFLFIVTDNTNFYVKTFRVIKCSSLTTYNNLNKLCSKQFAECIVEYDDLDKVSIDNPTDYKPDVLRNMSIEDLEKTITNTRRIRRKMELVRKNNPMEFVKSNYDIVRKLLARSLFIRHEIELNRRRKQLNDVVKDG